jgi:hypothetical protein
MQTFTEQFKALSLDQKQKVATDERRTRVAANLDKYVCIPIAVPKMSQVSSTPVDFQLGWAIGVPGEQLDDAGQPARAALTLGFPDEESAEDFCFALNHAREQRKMNASGEFRS